MPKEGNVNASIGPFVSRTDYHGSSTQTKAPFFGDFGFIVNGDINDSGALEIALFHMQKVYFREENSKTIAEKTELMHITMGYRYWLSPLFSTSLALSSSYPMNQPQVMHTDFATGQNIDTSARDTVDYGFDISIQGELWQRDRYSVFADARYGLSVTEKRNEDGSHYGLLIGLKYLVQEKHPTLTKEKN
ncbi:hypothetical protein CIK05_01555 [Bdellovibrio sp. qaytius]|nr:hypothetical protein CIK05_01555 [Bdellovibrio sp. qaytius]